MRIEAYIRDVRSTVFKDDDRHEEDTMEIGTLHFIAHHKSTTRTLRILSLNTRIMETNGAQKQQDFLPVFLSDPDADRDTS